MGPQHPFEKGRVAGIAGRNRLDEFVAEILPVGVGVGVHPNQMEPGTLEASQNAVADDGADPGNENSQGRIASASRAFHSMAISRRPCSRLRQESAGIASKMLSE